MILQAGAFAWDYLVYRLVFIAYIIDPLVNAPSIPQFPFSLFVPCHFVERPAVLDGRLQSDSLLIIQTKSFDPDIFPVVGRKELLHTDRETEIKTKGERALLYPF